MLLNKGANELELEENPIHSLVIGGSSTVSPYQNCHTKESESSATSMHVHIHTERYRWGSLMAKQTLVELEVEIGNGNGRAECHGKASIT